MSAAQDSTLYWLPDWTQTSSSAAASHLHPHLALVLSPSRLYHRWGLRPSGPDPTPSARRASTGRISGLPVVPEQAQGRARAGEAPMTRIRIAVPLAISLTSSAPIKSGLFRFLAILDSEARLGLESCSASQIDAVIFAANPPGDDVGSAPATAVIGEGHGGGGGRRPMKQRLLVVANRLPVSAVRRGEESWSLDISAGGLVSALLGESLSFSLIST
ncbi:uncharacterized protein A4U43_C08F34060, partial [Asparagus officinalis]